LCLFAESRKSLNAPFIARFIADLIHFVAAQAMPQSSDAWTCRGFKRAQGNGPRTSKIFRSAVRAGNAELDGIAYIG
jgi:hypothetical protein